MYLRSEGQRILFGRSNPQQRPGFVEGLDWTWLEPTVEVALPRFGFLGDAGLDRRATTIDLAPLQHDRFARGTARTEVNIV